MYKEKKSPAYEQIKFSVTIMRGCFGGLHFLCSSYTHQGRTIQSRSQKSILAPRSKTCGAFPATQASFPMSAAPTANMYKMRCKDPETETVCKRLSCIDPTICRRISAMIIRRSST